MIKMLKYKKCKHVLGDSLWQSLYSRPLFRDFFLSKSITILLEENGGLVGHSFFILETLKYDNKIWETHLIFFNTLKRWVEEVKLNNPPHGTTAHSQPLASHNFCLHIVLFCAVSCQLWHRRSLAAHYFTPSSHLKPGSPHWSTASKLSLHSCNGYMVERESLYMSRPL